ncbi:MAG: hypothetical protein IJ685_12250 [Selenomonadaceae bacterium]|nr:hypothetical protein [Selenomonadaceae bacterium]
MPTKIWSSATTTPTPRNPGNYNDGTTVYVIGANRGFVDLNNTGFYGTAVNIDATNSTGENNLSGNLAANIILGGMGDNTLWGGADFANDILVGGTGEDDFFYGKSEGSDSIINASANDEIHLYDVTLSDIVATASDGLSVGILLSTGNVLTVSGTDIASAEFKLANGVGYQYNYLSKTWAQTN